MDPRDILCFGERADGRGTGSRHIVRHGNILNNNTRSVAREVYYATILS